MKIAEPRGPISAGLLGLLAGPPGAGSDGVAALLFELASQDSGPSMSRYVAKKAAREQLSEFLVHK
ncbi:MAG: hypothetical protein QOH19_951, partial [Actinomycetota bacterium]|nr:hypothetical protein [Actinomycetota bacterium]